MFRLTLPRRLIETLRPRLELGEAPIELPLGLRFDGDDVEFVAPPSPRPVEPGSPRLQVGLFPEHLRGATHAYWHAFPLRREPQPRVDLALFRTDGCSAAVLCDGRASPLAAVRIVGAGMALWVPGASTPPPGAPEPASAPHDDPRDGPFSRYLMPIGGMAAHARLRALRIGIVGCSRLGSLFVTALGKVGVRDVVAIDEDRVEPHHLDAMDVAGPGCVGMRKVEAVAALQRELSPETTVHPVPHALEHPAAIAALSACDVVVTAPDRGQPRLLASLCAAAYCRVHLDIGTGVLRLEATSPVAQPFGDAAVTTRLLARRTAPRTRTPDPPPPPRTPENASAAAADLAFGAEVRLVLPGDCLMCVGGVDLDTRHTADWRRQRAGSLRSLNGMATSYALFLLERLVAGDIADTTWTRLRLDRQAGVRVERPPFARRAHCPVCTLSGRGDAVWAQHA